MHENRLIKSRNSSLNRSKSNLIENDMPVSCECSEHIGREFINQSFNLNVDYLFECLFSSNQFNINFNKLRKMTQTSIGEWKNETVNNIKCKVRTNEFQVALPGNFLGAKTCKNEVTEKLISSVPNRLHIVESDSINSGMTYADCFFVRTKFCMTRNTSTSSKLHVNVQVIFIQKPIFFIKNIIEKSCMSALDEYFAEMINCLNIESERLMKHPNGSVDDSPISSLSSSPSILSYSDKSNEINDLLPTPAPLITSKSTNDLSRSKSRERSATPTRLRHVRNKSFNDSVFVLSSRNNLKLDDSNSDDNHLNVNAQSSKYTNQPKSNLCSICNNNIETVNKNTHSNTSTNHISTTKSINTTSATTKNTTNTTYTNHKKNKSKYFDTDIFLKFFFIIMIFLLILNGVLYIKLKDIENIAITMKRNPKYATTLN